MHPLVAGEIQEFISENLPNRIFLLGCLPGCHLPPANQPAARNCSWWLLLDAICAVLMINAHIVKTTCALNVSSILQIKYFCFVIFLFKRMTKLLMASEIKAQNTDLNGSVASKCSPKSYLSLIWSSQAF